MFVRGDNKGTEASREDFSFYRGIVVKNNDPLKMNRVKIFIPELTNQSYDSWLEKYEQFIFKSIGVSTNNVEDKETLGSWEDVNEYETICNNIPWAEPCFPLMGESGNFRYWKDGRISSIGDGNFYEEGFTQLINDTATVDNGSFSPSFLFDVVDIHDLANAPATNHCVDCNPYSYLYRPYKDHNATKGVIGVPEVGSKVWLFHNNGDLNFPIYFGVYKDYRELAVIHQPSVNNQSMNYPGDFEN